MTFAVIGGQQRRRRTHPQHRHRNVQSHSGEIDAQLPQGKHHEKHDQIDEQVDADQQACQNEDDEDRSRGDGLRHVTARLLVDGVDGLFGFLFVLFLMFHHAPLSSCASILFQE